MEKLWKLLKGKKTYIVAAATIAVAGLNATGYPVPLWLYVALTALGGAAIKNGQNTASVK